MQLIGRLALGVATMLGFVTAACAQPAGPPYPPWVQQPLPSPSAPLPGAGTPQPAPAQATPSVTARVQQYLLTPHGEVDGLLLADGTAVRFPPHQGVALASTVKPGDNISAVGFLGPTTAYGRAMKALTITNTATGQTVVDQPPLSRPVPPHLRGLVRAPLTVTGPVARFLVNPKGDVDGLVLTTGEQVKFKPHHGVLILTLLGRTGGAVTASGYGTRNAFGTVVDAESVAIGTQALSLRGKGKGR
jgi:hypothetical protein